jgi:hypothetical protein
VPGSPGQLGLRQVPTANQLQQLQQIQAVLAAQQAGAQWQQQGQQR